METFTANYTKSIRLFPNGFSLLKHENHTETTKDFPAMPYSFLTQNAPVFFPKNEPDGPGIMVMNDIHPPLLIPEQLFDEENAPAYLKLQFNIEEPVKVYHDQIGEYISLHFLKNETVNILDKLQYSYHVRHLTSLLYDHIHQYVLSANPTGILTFFMNGDFTDYMLEKEGKLVLVNRFSFMTEFDLLYHTLNILKQYGLETSGTELLLYNNTNKKMITALKDYFPHLSILK